MKGTHGRSGRSGLRSSASAFAAFAALAAIGAGAASSAAADPPANRSLPSVAGVARVGEIVRAREGDWVGTRPLRFTYQWRRCGRFGSNCIDIAGATARSYGITPGDLGRTLRVRVTATNAEGSSSAVSRASAVVRARTASPPPPPPPPPAPSGPAGQVRLADGKISIPATSVNPPHRLIISGVSFSPSRVRSRSPFLGRFRVTDTRGFVVRDVLVYALGLPYGRILNAPEQMTGTDGYATIQFQPTARLPLQRGAYLVMFLRARKSGDVLLAGVSTRRLVQVTLGPPG